MARRSSTVTSRRWLALPALAVAFTALSPLLMTGCETSSTRRHRLIRANLTPELRTLHQRKVDQQNAIAITFDENGRMFSQDLGRAFMTDRPSRLTPEPVPH